MVSDTRSGRQIKDDLDGSSLKKELINGKGLSPCSLGKADGFGVRRSARETSSSRQTTPSPESTRKSKHLEKGTPSLTPLVKRTSERLEKQNTLSPLRRSDRGKKTIASSSSGSQQSAKDFKLSDSKKEQEKNWTQVMMKSEKTKLDADSVGVKRNKMNARTFKGLFKRQRIKEIVPDVDGELEGPNKLSRVCGDDNRVASEPMGKGEGVSHECSRREVGKWRDESIDNVSDGALPKSISRLNGSDADILGRDINVGSKHMNNVVNESPEAPDGDGLIDSKTSLSIREIFNDSERLPINHSSINNMDATESESSTCLERLQDGVINSGSGVKCTRSKETTPPSAKRDSLLRTCVLCSKKKRVRYDSPEQELCSCCATVDKDLGSFSTCEDRDDHGDSVTLESAEICVCRNLLKETHSLCQMDGHQNVCAICNMVGKLLCCEGKDCKRCFHPYCLDPPLTDVLPGVWHCPQCVKKKLVLGVHSVSEGVESIWDVREVELTNAKGMQRQKQYLVKYRGLAHIYNHWVSEKNLLLENPCVVSNSIAKDQIGRWSAKWMVPHRLLRRRSVQDKFHTASSVDISECHYEWLVKWHGLSYDQATWELDSAYFLSSALGRNLMNDYEIRREKAVKKVDKRKESFVKLSELPVSGWHVNDNNLLNNVNRLRECWFKSQNSVAFDNQARTMAVIFFIGSMTELCQPFLIVAASDSFSQWEGEFARLAPSVDVVVYSGSRDTRKGIRASEFYEEGGCVMLQVLLSSPEAVFEDLDTLRCIRWEAIVIDEYQHSGISNDLEQIKLLTTDLRILLVSDQIKNTTSEYLNILSLLDSHGDFDKLRSLKSDTNDNLGELKEKLSRFVAYRSTSEASKFLEYWVPAQISNHQLEQYCATLLSNSTSLCSCSRNDPVGALRDILLTVRKCCDHPYLVDSSVQERMIAEKHPAAEVLDIGIKAGGKLQLLDMMLTEIKTRGLNVVILYQSIRGSGGATTGDILDDFLRQRFGQNTYERIDAMVALPKKQAAVNRFNKKETGQFIFLLENRACSSTIKLLSLDIIVIYDSDWNPANDLRALQKISIDLKVEPIKVFRLYSSYTVEERALVLAKKNLNLDNNLQTKSRATSDTLLMWGASYLFQKLDDYHAYSNIASSLNISSGQSLLNEVTMEFQAILSESFENSDLNSVISKARLNVGSYSVNIPVHGEAKVQLKDGEEPYVFWKNLLDRKIPHWKHLRGSCSRQRKRVQYLDESPFTENDDVGKKRKRVVNDNVNPASVQLELGEHQVTEGAGSKGPLTIIASNQSQPLQKGSVTSNSNPNCNNGQSSGGTEVDVGESDESIASFDELTSLHSFLKGESTRLCQVLKLSEDVKDMVRKFLDYVIKNHKVSTGSPAYVQALQISLCWIAASILKQKVDKKDSLMLAKQLLNYQCTEEQVNSVYAKMRSLKRIYFHCSENFIVSGKNYLLSEEDISKEPSNVNEAGLHFSAFELQNFKIDIEEESANEEHAEDQIRLQQKMAMNDKASGAEVENKVKTIKKKCDKRMKKLVRKQQEEIQEFHRIWEEKRKELGADHRLKSAIIRSIHDQGSVRMDKLKLLTDNFAKKMEEHNLVKDMELKDLETKQLDIRNEERQRAAHWLAEAKACASELKAVNGPRPLGCQSEEDAGCSQSSTRVAINGPMDVVLMSRLQTEDQNPTKSVCMRGNDVVLSNTCISAPAEEACCSTPIETLSDLAAFNEQSEMPVLFSERSSLAMVEQPNQSKHSSDTDEIVSVDLPASGQQISDEIQLVKLSKEVPKVVLETVLNEAAEHVDPLPMGNEYNKEYDNGDAIGLLDAVENPRNGGDEGTIGDLPFPGRQLDLSEQTVASPDHCGLLPQQVPQEHIPQRIVSSELHDQDAPVVDQSTQIGVSTSELVDTVTPLQFNHEASVTENCEWLHPVSDYVSLGCNQSPACEVVHQNHDQGRSSFQTSEAGETEVLLHEPVSQSGENLELHRNHLDLGPASRVSELPNQARLNLGLDAGHLHGPSYLLAHPTHQVSTCNSTPSLFAEPLQNELERIHKETEQLEKSHEEVMSQLKSDCEKKIQELITHIRNECEVKLKDAEAEFRLKKNELGKNHTKVLMNKMLAEAFRSKCLDFRPSGLPGMQQGIPPSVVQHLHQLSLSPSMRSSLGGAPACQPVRSLQATSPAAQVMQAMQQLPSSQSMRPSPVTAPPVQAVQRAAALFSNTPSRPPVISAITPSGNPRICGEIRSPAPHLQPFRPASASSVPLSISPSIPQYLPPSQPFQLPQPPSAQKQSTNFVSQIRPEPQSGLPSPHLALSELELLMDMDNQPPSESANHTLPPLPSVGLTFGSLEQSDLGNVQASSPVATDVVCLSDDE